MLLFVVFEFLIFFSVPVGMAVGTASKLRCRCANCCATGNIGNSVGSIGGGNGSGGLCISNGRVCGGPSFRFDCEQDNWNDIHSQAGPIFFCLVGFSWGYNSCPN